MKDLVPTLDNWIREGKKFAIARVIQTWGSSPRPIGAGLLVTEDLEMAGSVSGGCVEGSVLKEAKRLLGNPGTKSLAYGVSDEEAWSVGLTCGGKIRVFVQVISGDNSDQRKVWLSLVRSLIDNKPVILISKISDSEDIHTLLEEEGTTMGSVLPAAVRGVALEISQGRKSDLVKVGEAEYFIQVFPRKSHLLIVGAAHITSDLVHLAAFYDFETTVIDPRGTFAQRTHFINQPDRILEKYPAEVLNDFPLDVNTYAVILSHDPKIDDNALQLLLRSKVAYIGALGSRKTHENRIVRLKQAGFTDQEIKRIESPIGVDIGAIGAREIALSIMGSLVRARNSIKVL